MIDIIFLTNGNLPILKKAVESIKTAMKYQLIVVDSASDKEVEEYVKERWGKYLPTAGAFNFSRNVNIGVKFGKNPLKLVCNDDIEFTEEAIDIMIATMERERCGMVGPVSNGVMNPDQKITKDYPADTQETTHTLNFFCVLINEGVFKDIGYMDKQFTGYGCDDDDFCLRALKAGHRLMVAGAYVKHEATTTYNGLDKQTLFGENIAKFKKKWGTRPAQDWKLCLIKT